MRNARKSEEFIALQNAMVDLLFAPLLGFCSSFCFDACNARMGALRR